MTDLSLSRSDTPRAEPRREHPLLYAGRWIAADFLSTIMFVGLYALTHSVYASTGLAIAVGIGQIAYLKRRGSPIDRLQWMSLGLVTVFGTASLATNDPRFIMLKPTLIYAAVGAVMLKQGWMSRYLPPVALQWSGDVTMVFGYAWAGMMFSTAALSLYFAIRTDPMTWVWVMAVFPIASKIALVLVQYLTTRIITRGRMRAAGSHPVPAGRAAAPGLDAAACGGGEAVG